jgi:hypothetical protein
LIRQAAVLVVGVVAVFAWQRYRLKDSETGLVSGNGRIEAVEIDVAGRTAAFNSLPDELAGAPIGADSRKADIGHHPASGFERRLRPTTGQID